MPPRQRRLSLAARAPIPEAIIKTEVDNIEAAISGVLRSAIAAIPSHILTAASIYLINSPQVHSAVMKLNLPGLITLLNIVLDMDKVPSPLKILIKDYIKTLPLLAGYTILAAATPLNLITIELNNIAYKSAKRQLDLYYPQQTNSVRERSNALNKRLNNSYNFAKYTLIGLVLLFVVGLIFTIYLLNNVVEGHERLDRDMMTIYVKGLTDLVKSTKLTTVLQEGKNLGEPTREEAIDNFLGVKITSIGNFLSSYFTPEKFNDLKLDVEQHLPEYLDAIYRNCDLRALKAYIDAFDEYHMRTNPAHVFHGEETASYLKMLTDAKYPYLYCFGYIQPTMLMKTFSSLKNVFPVLMSTLLHVFYVIAQQAYNLYQAHRMQGRPGEIYNKLQALLSTNGLEWVASKDLSFTYALNIDRETIKFASASIEASDFLMVLKAFLLKKNPYIKVIVHSSDSLSIRCSTVFAGDADLHAEFLAELSVFAEKNNELNKLIEQLHVLHTTLNWSDNSVWDINAQSFHISLKCRIGHLPSIFRETLEASIRQLFQPQSLNYNEEQGILTIVNPANIQIAEIKLREKIAQLSCLSTQNSEYREYVASSTGNSSNYYRLLAKTLTTVASTISANPTPVSAPPAEPLNFTHLHFLPAGAAPPKYIPGGENNQKYFLYIDVDKTELAKVDNQIFNKFAQILSSISIETSENGSGAILIGDHLVKIKSKQREISDPRLWGDLVHTELHDGFVIKIMRLCVYQPKHNDSDYKTAYAKTERAYKDWVGQAPQLGANPQNIPAI